MAIKLEVNQIANASSVAATTSYGPFEAVYHTVESVQVVWTSTTASFSITVEHSHDNSNWITQGSAQAVSNNSGTFHIVPNHDAPYWRVTATRTSGTLTTLKAYVAYRERT